MTAIETLETLTAKGILFTVLIECEAAMGGKSWLVVLSDNHSRKGHAKAQTLEAACRIAITDLNQHCGGQLRNYLTEG